jgi:NADH:ubiquinone oxidoreductase subunit F (NADH-binding)
MMNKLTCTGMDYSNALDATSTHQHNWRIKVIAHHLPTLEKALKLYKSSDTATCPRCTTCIETQSHIWTCAHTIQTYDKLRLDTSPFWPHVSPTAMVSTTPPRKYLNHNSPSAYKLYIIFRTI